jgi:hypothetical protein
MAAEKVVSPSGSIDWIGIKKVGKGALIAGAGAALTYLLEAIPGLDFGIYTTVVGAGLSILVNFGIKFFSKY